jgi:hypothetical protein
MFGVRCSAFDVRRSMFDVRCSAFMTETYAYWLIPAEPFRRWCKQQIARLTKELDAPLFEPHVTAYVRRAVGHASPAPLLAQAAPDLRPITLHVLRTNHSEKFTKTLFIEFAHSSSLIDLSTRLRELCPESPDYKLRPHLSLAYKHLAKRRRAALAQAIEIPFNQMTFNEVAAVICPERTQNARDVRAWHVLHRQAM